jgi:hypothetical protein
MISTIVDFVVLYFKTLVNPSYDKEVCSGQSQRPITQTNNGPFDGARVGSGPRGNIHRLHND